MNINIAQSVQLNSDMLVRIFPLRVNTPRGAHVIRCLSPEERASLIIHCPTENLPTEYITVAELVALQSDIIRGMATFGEKKSRRT